MKAVLQSIRPKWTEKIFQGIKKKELRKSKPVGIEFPFIVYVYETRPGVGKIIGEYTCENIITSENASTVEPGSCVPIDEIMLYKGSRKICGWDISNVVLYDKPIPLLEFGLSRPPQSWCYVERMV